MLGVGAHTRFLALLHAPSGILGSVQTQVVAAEGAVVSTVPPSEAAEAHYLNEAEQDLASVVPPSAPVVVPLVLSR